MNTTNKNNTDNMVNINNESKTCFWNKSANKINLNIKKEKNDNYKNNFYKNNLKKDKSKTKVAINYKIYKLKIK